MYSKLLFKSKIRVYISKGIANQPIKAKNKVKKGPKTNKNLLAFVGIIISLTTNFNPSAKGCKNPQIPTTFGPLRRWIEAIALRSAKVKNATTINNGIKVNNECTIKSK
jgi:hypothetical protein